MKIFGIIAGLIMVGVAFASPAHAATHESWKFKTGEICVKDHGWTAWSTAAVVTAWDASTDIRIVRSATCAGYPTTQIVTLAQYKSTENACAKTASPTGYTWEYSYTKQGAKVAVWTPKNMTIWFNVDPSKLKGCNANVGMRKHVMAHELGHAVGVGHPTVTPVNSVMYYWSLQAPTAWDIRNVNTKY